MTTVAFKLTDENVVAGIASLSTLGPSFVLKTKYRMIKTNVLACSMC